MFGNSALAETGDFYAGDDAALSVKQTALYRSLVDEGADGEGLYRTIQDFRHTANDESLSSLERGKLERAIIGAADLTDRQRARLYTGLISGSEEKWTALLDAGLSWDEASGAYDRYQEIKEGKGKAGEKATEFAVWADRELGGRKAEAAKNTLKFYSQIPAEAGRYEKLSSAGLSEDAAYRLTKVLDGLGEDATSLERYRAVVDAGLSAKQQLAALGTVMGEGEFKKVSALYDLDVGPELYVSAREAIAAIDDNGTVTQAEAKMAIKNMDGLTREQRAALWQVQNKAWKPGKNPFSTTVGRAVYNALSEEGPEWISLPGVGG